MKIKPTEIEVGIRLVNGCQSYMVIDKVKETPKTITFLVKHYKDDRRCLGDFTEKEITFRKSTTVESREETVGTKLDQLHRIKLDRLKDCVTRGFELYRVKGVNCYNYERFDIGDFMFAWFNGINYETESILDDGTVNAIPPSKNSNKPQISGYNNKYGGFEDYYEKIYVDDDDDNRTLVDKYLQFFNDFKQIN